jgi:hypothetical protein
MPSKDDDIGIARDCLQRRATSHGNLGVSIHH